jgi:hypothetical protein
VALTLNVRYRFDLACTAVVKSNIWYRTQHLLCCAKHSPALGSVSCRRHAQLYMRAGNYVREKLGTSRHTARFWQPSKEIPIFPRSQPSTSSALHEGCPNLAAISLLLVMRLGNQNGLVLYLIACLNLSIYHYPIIIRKIKSPFALILQFQRVFEYLHELVSNLFKMRKNIK